MPLAKIDKVEARLLAVPLDRPARIARRDLRERHYTFTRVHAEGQVGIGFCLGGAPATAFVRFLAPHVVGRDVADTERLWDELYYETILLGRRGAGIRALSTIDIANWDLKAKLLGLLLAKHLGVF